MNRSAVLLTACLAVTLLPADTSTAQGLPEEDPGTTTSRDDGEVETVVRVDRMESGLFEVVCVNADINVVLQHLSFKAERNIVPSAAVQRLVNVFLYNVTFEEVLNGLLDPYDLGSNFDGDILYIYTNEELSQRGLESYELISRVIHLDYISADEAAAMATPLLSADGKIHPIRDGGGDAISDQGGATPPAANPGGGGANGGAAGGAAGSYEVYSPDEDRYSLMNALVVHDYAQRIDRITDLLNEVDVRPAQILIEVTIVSASLTEENALGVDFALLTGEAFSEFFAYPAASGVGGVATAIGLLDNTAALPANEAFAVSSSGKTGTGNATLRLGGILSDDVGVFLRALDEVTDVSLLSNPKVLTLNRQRGRVHVGENVGYLQTTIVENQVQETVRFIDTGIVLDIRPYVLKDGRIRMEVVPKVSDVEFRTSPNGTDLPDEFVQMVETDVLVPNGATAVIGGLFREQTTRNRSQTPGVGDVPYLGNLFKGREDLLNRQEIIFLVKPTILHEHEMIAQGRRAENEVTRLRIGTREGLLPWSRERQSSLLNIEARQQAESGDIDGALYKLRRSLELHPHQPGARKMVRDLTTHQDFWPGRSLLERIVSDTANATSNKPGNQR